MGAVLVTPTYADWHHSGRPPQFSVEEIVERWLLVHREPSLKSLDRSRPSSRAPGKQCRALTSVWASAHSSWELALSTVSPLGHPRLLLMSTVRSEPSIPDRSNLAFSPQSVQYMNLIEEVKQLVILTAPGCCEHLQHIKHTVSSCKTPDTSNALAHFARVGDKLCIF